MYLREILTGVISTMINNLFKKKSFYKEKKTINVLTAFYHKSCIKTFLK